MPSLRDVQAAIRAAVVSEDDRAVAPLLVGGSDGRKRLAIHRRHYHASLVAALQEKFPATVWLVGSAFFLDAAYRFVRARPPAGPCIAEYGDEFPAFLASLPAAAQLPYLRDFAELERRLAQVAIEIDRPALSIGDIAARGGDTLADAVVALQPGLRYWHASWPVDELLRAYLTDSAPERFEIELDSVYIEVRGARGDVTFGRLSLGDFTFRSDLQAGARLDDAIGHAMGLDPAFDPREGFLALVHSGLVTGIDCGPAAGVS
jgi:hypothetical protein